jgi:serine/threonine protein kinase
MFRGTAEDSRRILTDVARGLEFLHSRGIVHNDLKPGNVLYSRERGAIICDLGLASVMEKTRDCGTPWYVATENRARAHFRVAADDCWSLGIIGLYVLKMLALPDTTFPVWHISQMAVPGSPAAKLADEWYDGVARVRRGLNAPDGGGYIGAYATTGTEIGAQVVDASRDRLIQCVLRLTDNVAAERLTADGVPEMLA